MFGTPAGLGYWDLRQQMDRKYDLQAREVAAQEAQVKALGMLQGAQANEIGVRAGLLPKTTAADIAFKNAGTAQMTEETSLLRPKFNVDAALTGAQTTGLTIQNQFAPRRYAAEIGRIGAETGEIGARTRGLGLQNRLLKSNLDFDTGYGQEDLSSFTGFSPYRLGLRRATPARPSLGFGLGF